MTMMERKVEFHGRAGLMRGIVRVPSSGEPKAMIVHPPGWLGLAEANTYLPVHRDFVAAGYGVLAFNYRGFGQSEGPKRWIVPDEQVDDLRSAIAFAQAPDGLGATDVGLFGTGAIGGGNVIVAAATDTSVRCVVVQSVIADGREWLRRMRPEHAWIAFLQRLNKNRLTYAATGTGELVNPRTEIMVQTPERIATNQKKDVDAQLQDSFFLASADAIMRFRPIDYVARIAPRGLMVTAVADDAVTPLYQAEALFAEAGHPKKFVRFNGVTHYEQYEKFHDEFMEHAINWFGRHLRSSAIEVIDHSGHAPTGRSLKHDI